MKIHQLLSNDIQIVVSNEEQQFMSMHNDKVKLTALNDHDQWIAQGLVRKNIYKIDEDNITLIKNTDE